ncbi:DUF402 domain-containing protein [Mycoplasma phocimorsus]|uniref:DUF402 domain-containing protein n=1 Tax=Mycoplasma phocimorsus TaxID=3045839 RepID=UPI0024BFF8F2|nr:DUF402 domain-containing protein [Mycoplasma phocimorsus]MDJ1648213.1 DUF402 domain-containing protein [Mycoplasma phocimorsus]
MKDNNFLHEYINVQAYKHDGTLYRQWNNLKVIYENSKYIILFPKKAKVSEINNKIWSFNNCGFWFFPKKELYNCLLTIRPDGNYFYFNMASKYIFEDNTIKYIDYDLDIKIYPKDTLRIVDREEFTKNKLKYKYPNKLVKSLYKVIEKIIGYYYNDLEMFDYHNLENLKTILEQDKLLLKFQNKKIKDKHEKNNSRIY